MSDRRLPGQGRLDADGEAFLAELTDAAYRVALRHGPRASFLDVQLDIWNALRPIVARQGRIRRAGNLAELLF
jgi:hypothetical protein